MPLNAVIKITDDKEEQIAIAKRLVESKKSYYTEWMIDSVKESIKAQRPGIGETEMNEIFYISVYDFWVYGNNINEEFYLDFLHKSHEEKKKFIVFRNRFTYIYHLNDRKSAHLFDNKYEAYELLKPYYLREIIRIAEPIDFPVFLDFVKRHPTFISKPESLGCSMGIQKITVDPADEKGVRETFDTLLEFGKEIVENVVDRTNTAVVIEEVIEQDESIGKLNPMTVNGVRIPTFRVNGKVTIFYPWMKIGATDNVTACFTDGSGFGSAIDAGTGVLCTDGMNEKCEIFVDHPYSGIKIKGFQIPKWDELCTLATTLAESLPENINYIAWDFVLTPRGWCVMEGNYCGEFMWEMFYHDEKHGMRAEIEELLGWKPEK